MRDGLNKKKTSVQFDVTNTTSNATSFNLFELGITPTPTQDTGVTIPPTGLSFGASFLIIGAQFHAVNPNNGDMWLPNGIGVLSNIEVRSSLLGLITTIPIGVGQPKIPVYCPFNDSFYIADTTLAGNVYVVDATTYTLTTIIGGFAGAMRGIVFVPSTNEIWVTTNNALSPIQIVDVTTNTITTSLNLGFTLPTDLEYYPTNDWVIVAGEGTNTIGVIDVQTQLLVTAVATTLLQPNCVSLVNNKIYVGYSSLNTSFDIFDLNTLTITNNIVFSGVGGTIVQNNFVYVPAWDLVYFYPSANGRIYFVNATTETLAGSFVGVSAGVNGNVTFNPVSNIIYAQQGGFFYAYQGTITSTPFYIGGAVDYNFFVQNLEYEPIILECIKVITQNQDQLSNALTIKKIDADGHENQFPEFPILDVSAWQEQGNRATVPLNGLILDGRTYFSNYVINANETVIIELCYEQLNRFAFTKHPELFSSLKPISEKQKEKIENRIIERDKEESGEKESKFEIIKDTLVIDIDITNNTAGISTFNLFEANQNQLIVNTPSVTFANVGDYNYLVQQLRDSPLVINSIEVITNDQNQLTIPLSVQTKDANGDSITYQHFPINTVSAYQQKPNRAFFKTNHLILDGYTTFASYNILPNVNVSFVIYYKQFKRSLFLQNHVFTKLKKPIFNNGMGFAEEIEYFNEVTENANNKKIVNHLEKSINFGDEQVYSFGFDGSRKDAPFISSEKKDINNPNQKNQSIFNYRDVFNKLHGNSGKKKIFE